MYYRFDTFSSSETSRAHDQSVQIQGLVSQMVLDLAKFLAKSGT